MAPKLDPKKPRNRRLTESENHLLATLNAAEIEHYGDCPTADGMIRTAAVCLDLILLFILASSAEASIQLVAILQNTPHMAVLIIAVKLTLCFVYLICSVAYMGGTPGKLLLGLRVLSQKTGKYLSLPQAAYRELGAKFLLGILTSGVIWILPLVRTDHLGLHDIIAKSVVKKVHGGR